MPGRVLVVVLLWFDGVSHFFSAVCPQGVDLPVAFTLLLVVLLYLFFSLFFGALPYIRLRVSLIFVFLFHLFCPCGRVTNSPAGRVRGSHLALFFAYFLLGVVLFFLYVRLGVAL